MKRGESVEPLPPAPGEGPIGNGSGGNGSGEAAAEPKEIPALEDVRRLALSRAGSFVDEIRSSLEFYAAQVPGARIARVRVIGGGSRLDGFLQLLQERIPVPVDRGRLFERVKSELDLSAEATAEAEAVLSVAVGLAIPERRRA